MTSVTTGAGLPRRGRPGSAEGGLFAGSSALVISRLVVAALGWAGTVIIAQRLSIEQFGQFSFVFGVLGLTTIVTNLGVGRVVLAALVRERDDVEEFAGTYIVLRAIVGVVGYAAAIAVVGLGGYPLVVVQATALAGLMVVIATPSHALDAIYQARMRMPVVAVAVVLGQLGQFGLTIALALWRPTLLWLVIPFVVNEALVVIWKRRHLASMMRPHLCVRPRLWRAMLVDAVPLTIGGALQTLYFKVDIVMLSRLDTFKAVGIYNIGYKFADVVVMLAGAVLTPAVTLMVRAWPGDLEGLRSTTRRVGGVLGLAAMFVGVEFALLADPAISLLYGERYAVGASAAALMVAAACLHVYVLLGYDVLVATGHQRAYPWVTLVGLVVNVGLNLVLIPAHSYRGAAIATLTTEVVVLTWMWVVVRRSTGLRELVDRGRLTGTLATGAAAGLVGFGAHLVAPWPVVGVAAALTFAGVGHLSGAARGLAPEGWSPRRPWRSQAQAPR